ncbi:type IV secretion system protein VirB10 [Oligella urethralis]|uniref:Type IV secretion system protein virB10 n=1 Tax=Oligella urethralis TaxID=90245 RepID=A0A2N6QF83_9BURK|nr:type IV secretion system protein VirB10 [Oligella urethralis]PMC18233.1 conjugal transfer protein TrbI [Oligella urethralis]SPY09097.1 Type IV secretion system protein virB10 [Oligella urethralis]
MFGKKKNELSGGIADHPEQPDLSTEIQDMSVERGQVNAGELKRKNNVKKVFFTGVMVVLVLVVVISVMSFLRDNPVSEEVESKSTATQAQIRNSRPQTFDLERTQQPPPPPIMPPEVAPSTQMPGAGQINTMVIPPEAVEPPPEPDRKLSGSVLFEIDTSERSNQHDSENAHGGRETILSNRLVPTVSVPTVAQKRADLTYLLRKGTNIGCTLNTKIITTHPGITRCIVSKDVYSADGKVLLIERGSEIIGEQTTSLLQGQARVFVLWTDIETPHGVKLQIDSPSADSLGASGQEAQVDTHFWKRFGGAIMLSMIDDVMAIASDRATDRQYRFDNTSDAVEDMAAKALENTINIPPTGYVNQGTLVNVMVARDVDFSTVYELVNPYFVNY